MAFFIFELAQDSKTVEIEIIGESVNYMFSQFADDL